MLSALTRRIPARVASLALRPLLCTEQLRFAGHSKWSKIKHAKGDADAKKSTINTKISKEIATAVKAGGADPTANLRLAYALDKARANNVSKEVVDNCIRRVVEGKEGAIMETVFYEGTGPGGTAFMVECLTDKRTRTGASMRHVFSKFGGDLGGSGSVGWQFETFGLITVNLEGGSKGEDALLAAAMELDASDVQVAEGVAEVYCPPAATHVVRNALEKDGFSMKSAEITKLAKSKVELNDKDGSVFSRLLEELEENEDVQNVYHNAE